MLEDVDDNNKQTIRRRELCTFLDITHRISTSRNSKSFFFYILFFSYQNREEKRVSEKGRKIYTQPMPKFYLSL
jgi:hypothetical protein